MTKKILLLSTFCFLCMSAFASFPVNKENVTKSLEKVEAIDVVDAQTVTSNAAPNLTIDAANALSPAAASGDDNTMIITILLWLFIGGLAGHRWYAKKPAGWNILFILTLGGLGIWWLVDGINILTDNF